MAGRVELRAVRAWRRQLDGDGTLPASVMVAALDELERALRQEAQLRLALDRLARGPWPRLRAGGVAAARFLAETE